MNGGEERCRRQVGGFCTCASSSDVCGPQAFFCSTHQVASSYRIQENLGPFCLDLFTDTFELHELPTAHITAATVLRLLGESEARRWRTFRSVTSLHGIVFFCSLPSIHQCRKSKKRRADAQL